MEPEPLQMTYVFIARATKERVPSLCGDWGQLGIGDVELNKRTTAFTIAVRSAQMVPPVTCYDNHLYRPIRGRHTIRCILYICSLDYRAIWGEKSRSDTEFRIRGICPILGYVGSQKSKEGKCEAPHAFYCGLDQFFAI